MPTYAQLERQYPQHVIIRKEGYFYSAHGRSAELISDYVGYRLGFIEGVPVTGSPDPRRMEEVLSEFNISFIIFEADGHISARHDGRDYRGVQNMAATRVERLALQRNTLIELERELRPKVKLIDEFKAMISKRITEGTTIDHAVFGKCRVESVEGNRMTVSCDTGKKRLGITSCLLNGLITVPGISASWIRDNADVLRDENAILNRYKETVEELRRMGIQLEDE